MSEDKGASAEAERATAAEPVVSALRDGISSASLDDFIFNWFNEREPEKMRACLDAYDCLPSARQDAPWGISHD